GPQPAPGGPGRPGADGDKGFPATGPGAPGPGPGGPVPGGKTGAGDGELGKLMEKMKSGTATAEEKKRFQELMQKGGLPGHGGNPKTGPGGQPFPMPGPGGQPFPLPGPGGQPPQTSKPEAYATISPTLRRLLADMERQGGAEEREIFVSATDMRAARIESR